MKLVSDIKQYLILNDFHSVNEAIVTNSQLYRSTQADCDKKLMCLRDEMAAELYDLEEEYYTSVYKWIKDLLYEMALIHGFVEEISFLTSPK